MHYSLLHNIIIPMMIIINDHLTFLPFPLLTYRTLSFSMSTLLSLLLYYHHHHHHYHYCHYRHHHCITDWLSNPLFCYMNPIVFSFHVETLTYLQTHTHTVKRLQRVKIGKSEIRLRLKSATTQQAVSWLVNGIIFLMASLRFYSFWRWSGWR